MVNGVVNREAGAASGVRHCVPAFQEASRLLAGLIGEREVGFRFDRGEEYGQRRVTLLIRDDPTTAAVPRIQRMLRLLRLAPETREVPVRYVFGRGAGAEIVVDPRPFLQLLPHLSASVLPPQVQTHSTTPTFG